MAGNVRPLNAVAAFRRENSLPKEDEVMKKVGSINRKLAMAVSGGYAKVVEICGSFSEATLIM